MAKVSIKQEHVFVPGKAKKRLRMGVFFLVVLAAAGMWVLAEDGAFESGVNDLKAAKQTYATNVRGEK